MGICISNMVLMLTRQVLMMFPFTLPFSPKTNFKTLYFSYPQALLHLSTQHQSNRLRESVSYLPTSSINQLRFQKKTTSFQKLSTPPPTNPEINIPPLNQIQDSHNYKPQWWTGTAFTDSECFSNRCDSENSTETLGSLGGRNLRCRNPLSPDTQMENVGTLVF